MVSFKLLVAVQNRGTGWKCHCPPRGTDSRACATKRVVVVLYGSKSAEEGAFHAPGRGLPRLGGADACHVVPGVTFDILQTFMSRILYYLLVYVATST